MTRRQLIISLAITSIGWTYTTFAMIEARTKLNIAKHDIVALQEISGIKLQSAIVRSERKNRIEFAMEIP